MAKHRATKAMEAYQASKPKAVGYAEGTHKPLGETVKPSAKKKDHLFKPGNQMAAGPIKEPRMMNKGRKSALRALEVILQDEDNIVILHKALLEEFHRDPVWFFRRIIMPVLPKEVKMSGVVAHGPLRLILETGDEEEIIEVSALGGELEDDKTTSGSDTDAA